MFFKVFYEQRSPPCGISFDGGVDIVVPIAGIIPIVAMKDIKCFDFPLFANLFKISVHIVFVSISVSPTAPH